MATPEDQEGLWFDEDPSPPRGGFRRRRTTWIVLACAACVAAVAAPVGLALSSSGGPVAHPAPKQSAQTPQQKAQAQRTVLSALSATTSSGSYNVSYEFDPATPPTVATTTTTSSCTLPVYSFSGPGSELEAGSGGSPELCTATPNSISTTTVTGQGTIDTDPFAMVATSDVTGLGMITIHDNGTDIWEFGGGDYGLEPGSNEGGPGSTLTGFAGSVEGTLGQRQGALAMGGLSSPTGYLDLDQSMITGADEIGTGTVDGTAVTIYRCPSARRKKRTCPIPLRRRPRRSWRRTPSWRPRGIRAPRCRSPLMRRAISARRSPLPISRTARPARARRRSRTSGARGRCSCPDRPARHHRLRGAYPPIRESLPQPRRPPRRPRRPPTRPRPPHRHLFRKTPGPLPQPAPARGAARRRPRPAETGPRTP